MAKEKEELFDSSQLIDSYFEDEIKTSYLNYAYSVITSRAIPDVHDGCKPVQRRVLFGMAELGCWNDKPTKKSARITGDVMGKYHPHGDSSIYMALVKMAQDFSIRYPLVIGQGNFGSIDDDPPAAQRYTEAKLSRVAEYMLEDLEKNTVDYRPNYDDTLQEPAVLPGKFPNLLCNGTTGIAVGLATDIPPHNFREVAAGIAAYIDKPTISIAELMQYIPGPDFPTCGVITDTSTFQEMYETGHGSIELAGKMIVEERGNYKDIIITEIPYRIIKSKLVEEITNLYLNSEGKYSLIMRGVKEVRDESSKEGIRVVIELFKDANAEAIKTAIYNQTAMKVRVKVNMTGLIKNHPRVLNLKDMIEQYVDHRRNVIIRRTKFDLDKAEKRLHIVEGLLIAIDNIDEIIKIIKSNDTPTAKQKLMDTFKLTEIQTEAILEMKLRNLTRLETNKLREEKAGLEKLIKELKDILNSPERRNIIIKTELTEMVEKIGDDRRTHFEKIQTEKIEAEELISNDPILLTVSKKGFLIREVGASSLKTGTRGTRGRKGDATDSDRLEDDDYIFATVSGFMKDTLIFVTDSGRTYSLKVYEIRGDVDGKITRSHIRNIDRLKEIEIRGEAITAVLVVSEFTDKSFILFISKKGKGARISLADFEGINRTGVNSVKLKPGDAVVSAVITDGSKKLFLVKRNAKGFRFSESLFPVHNRGVGGEKATSVTSPIEDVLGMQLADDDKTVIFVTKDGKGRRVKPSDFSELVNRGGKGYKIVDLGKNRMLASFALCEEEDTIVITTRNGRRISLTADKITRNLLKLIDVIDGDEVSAISTISLALPASPQE